MKTERNSFEVDFARLNRWCAASIAGMESQAVRTALFYVPSVTQGVLPPLPASERGAATAACRLQAIWYKTGADVSISALVKEFSSFWGKPIGQTTTPDIAGSALWKNVVAWHRNGMNIWTVCDLSGEPGRGGPRLIVYARRDIPRDQSDLGFGSLSYTIRNRVTDIAGQMAAQDPALTTAILDRTRCLAGVQARESESITASRLARWLKDSAGAPPPGRAAALLLADAYITCVQLSPQASVPLGAEFMTSCPQDGAAYSGNFLR
jgi:hypothetical protein